MVANWPIPSTVSDLLSFLGFASYYRCFVEDFVKLAAPLHKAVAEWGRAITGKSGRGVIGCWTSECQESFQALKARLTSAPVLAYADFSLPFILEVDASHGALGAVLFQEQLGKVRPVAYTSRGLQPTERNMANYSSMKLEFLALKWALTEKFRESLLGHKCVVYMDNNPLSHLSSANSRPSSGGQPSLLHLISKYSTGWGGVIKMQKPFPVSTHLALRMWEPCSQVLSFRLPCSKHLSQRLLR